MIRKEPESDHSPESLDKKIDAWIDYFIQSCLEDVADVYLDESEVEQHFGLVPGGLFDFIKKRVFKLDLERLAMMNLLAVFPEFRNRARVDFPDLLVEREITFQEHAIPTMEFQDCDFEPNDDYTPVVPKEFIAQLQEAVILDQNFMDTDDTAEEDNARAEFVKLIMQWSLPLEFDGMVSGDSQTLLQQLDWQTLVQDEEPMMLYLNDQVMFAAYLPEIGIDDHLFTSGSMQGVVSKSSSADKDPLMSYFNRLCIVSDKNRIAQLFDYILSSDALRSCLLKRYFLPNIQSQIIHDIQDEIYSMGVRKEVIIDNLDLCLTSVFLYQFLARISRRKTVNVVGTFFESSSVSIVGNNSEEKSEKTNNQTEEKKVPSKPEFDIFSIYQFKVMAGKKKNVFVVSCRPRDINDKIAHEPVSAVGDETTYKIKVVVDEKTKFGNLDVPDFYWKNAANAREEYKVMDLENHAEDVPMILLLLFSSFSTFSFKDLIGLMNMNDHEQLAETAEDGYILRVLSIGIVNSIIANPDTSNKVRVIREMPSDNLIVYLDKELSREYPRESMSLK